MKTCAALDKIKKDLGCSNPADMCVRYSLAEHNNWIDYFLCGVETLEQLQQNVDAFETTVPFTPEEVEMIHDLVGKVPEDFLNLARWPKK